MCNAKHATGSQGVGLLFAVACSNPGMAARITGRGL